MRGLRWLYWDYGATMKQPLFEEGLVWARLVWEIPKISLAVKHILVPTNEFGMGVLKGIAVMSPGIIMVTCDVAVKDVEPIAAPLITT